MSTDLEVVPRVESLIALERSGALTRTGLVLPNTITQDQITALGVALGEVHESVCWAVGDWLNAVDDLFSEEASQIHETLQLSEDKRDQYGRVARRYQRGSRRHELTFSHHRELASMKDERRRDELLQTAVEKRWTVLELVAAKKDVPIGELPGPSLDWRYSNLRRAAERVVSTKDMLADGRLYAVPVNVLDELAAAIEVQ